MAEPLHLWDADHPYYMTEGCFFSNGCHHEYDSWAEFLEEWGELDEDYNLVFRWDWAKHKPYDDVTGDGCEEGDHSDCSDVVKIYFILQRKGYPISAYTKVTDADEPAVLKYLTPKARHIARLWGPIWQGGAA